MVKKITKVIIYRITDPGVSKEPAIVCEVGPDNKVKLSGSDLMLIESLKTEGVPGPENTTIFPKEGYLFMYYLAEGKALESGGTHKKEVTWS